MTRTLMLSAAALAVIVATPALAASDAGARKLQPVHHEIQSTRIEHFKAVKEAAYENNTRPYREETQEVEGFAYGDQPNEIPATERVYHYKRGDMSDTPRVTVRTR